MIIKASKHDIEFLEKQLFELINENKSGLFQATDEEIRLGIATFSEDFSVNEALIERAVEQIRDACIKGHIEYRHYIDACQNLCATVIAQADKEREVDSIGTELLGVNCDDEIPW